MTLSLSKRYYNYGVVGLPIIELRNQKQKTDRLKPGCYMYIDHEQKTRLAKLPIQPVSWHISIRRLHTWLELEDGTTARPFVLLIIHLDLGAIVGFEFLTAEPHDQQILSLVVKLILHPTKDLSKDPYRPERIIIDEQSISKSIGEQLKQIGIEVDTQSTSPHVAQIIADIEDMLGWDEPTLPGLLTVTGVNPEMIGDLFSAAADFYLAAPWEALKDIQPLKITMDQFEVDIYVQLMGAAGLEFGMVLFLNWEDLIHTFKTAYDPLDQLPPGGWRSLTFEASALIHREDLDAIQEFDWRIASQEAYPLVVTYTKTSVERPTREELVYFEAIMRAIPLFFRKHLQPDGEGDYFATEQRIEVKVYSGPISLNMQYPAGDLRKIF